MDAYEALTGRRSPLELGDPGPSAADMTRIVEAAMNAPDHGRLKPWRFLVIAGPAREGLGEIFASAFRERNPAASEETINRERQKPLRAPLIVTVAAHVTNNPKIPAIEQILSAGAAAQNVMLAAHALGYGAQWKTGDNAYDERVKTALGLASTDAIVGFIYIGSIKTPAPAKPASEPSEHSRYWPGE